MAASLTANQTMIEHTPHAIQLHCCEVWGNNYKTRIQSLFILQKRAIRIICLNTNYKCHTKPLFYQLISLNVFDIIDLNSLVFMYKAFHNSLPANLLSYFKKVNGSHNHNIRNNNLNFKVRYRRTTKKHYVFVSKVLKCGIHLVQISS